MPMTPPAPMPPESAGPPRGMGGPPGAPPPPPGPGPMPEGGGGGLPPELHPDKIIADLPDGDFSLKAMKRLADSINDAIPVLAPEVGEQQIELPPEMSKGVQGKLPPQLAVPAVVILAVSAKFEPRYGMPASAFTDDKALSKASALIDAATKDKTILAAVKGEEPSPKKGKAKAAPMPKEDDVSEEVEVKEEVKEKAPPPSAAKYM